LKISIIGSGYVGSVTGICLAALKHEITLVDVDTWKVDQLNKGNAPVFEPGLNKLLNENRNQVKATTDFRSAILNTDITFIAVGTPSKEDGSIDLTYIDMASSAIGDALKEKNTYHLVIVKSTVLPGTTENYIQKNIENRSGKLAGREFGIATNPEFLREGNAVEDFFQPDRIIIGGDDDQSCKMIQVLYSEISCPKYFTTIKAAEMIKYVSNAFLATKISFANEIGNICKKIDVDSYQVFEGVGMDKRICPQFFRAGIGFGGSCFPKDIRALLAMAKGYGISTNILEATISVNNSQPLELINLLKRHIPDLEGKKIGLLGLAFKPATDDIRESRAIPLIKELLREKAEVVCYDPLAIENFREMCNEISFAYNANEVLQSDAILIVTEWPEFENLDYSGKIVIDGRRVAQAKKTAGKYEGVCW
jgi:UDPglucose 6-dehydrogenase